MKKLRDFSSLCLELNKKRRLKKTWEVVLFEEGIKDINHMIIGGIVNTTVLHRIEWQVSESNHLEMLLM